jgi:hypothetical protein
MAKLKDIKGSAIQYLAEDPVEYVGSWSSGGSLNTGRGLMGNGIGTQTAAAVVAGLSPPSTYYDRTEEYNGSSWTESGDLAVSLYQGMAGGTQTAAIYAGGYGGSWPANAETYYYNGTSWTDQSADLNTARDSLRGTGVQTAAIAAGGISGPGVPADDETEIWNGSSWTEVNNLNSARYSHNVAGTSTDAIAGPGTAPPGYVAAVETWNGTSWTETTEINTSRNNYARTNYAAGGASTGALIFGGQSQPTGSPDSLAQTEEWNGSAWTEIADLGTGRGRLAGAGTTTAALAVGAYPSTNNTATEEFSFPGPTSTILQEGQLWFNYSASALKGYDRFSGVPTATWASVANMNVPRSQPGTGAGSTSTDCLVIGGYQNPPLQYKANIENFDGSTWTELNDLNEGRQFANGGGTRTSAIIFGGSDGSNVTSTESWDGTSMTEVADLNTARATLGGASQANTAALAFGGATPSYTNATENWDGSSWTEVNNLNNTRGYINGAGTPTNAIAISGEPTPRNYVESWDGTSWTEIAEINTARAQGGCSGFGTNTNVIFFGGEPGSNTITELWNGSSWTEIGDMGTARTTPGGAGTSIAGMAFGGNPTKSLAEEFTADSTLADVTVS